MAITTYAELKTAVSTWIRRADLTSGQLDDVIMIAEKYIFRNTRNKDMEAALSVALSGGVAAVPTDFLELKFAYIDGSPARILEIQSPTWIYSNYPNRSQGGPQCFVARDGANFIFGPGGAGGDLKGTYYKTLTAVATSANALFTANPDLYLSAALAETMDFVKDQKFVDNWRMRRDQIIADINRINRVSHGGGAMAVRVA
jgi:hypothetical protein